MKDSAPALSLRISPSVLKWVFLAGPWILSAIGLSVEYAAKQSLDPELHGLVPILSLSHEGNFPTLYQGLALAACSAMLVLTGRAQAARKERWARHWTWLGIGFGYMALDEWTSIHELLNTLMNLHGALLFSWIIPYSIAAAVIVIAFVPFVLALPRGLAARFVLAGVVYLSGAIGMELPLGAWTDAHGTENFHYAVLDWTEETLEMIGAGWFAASVFGVFRRSVGALHVEVPPVDEA